MNRSHPQSVRLEVDSLTNLLRRGYLTASPTAEIVADPFAYGIRGEAEIGPRFIFSDIPDVQFREPRDILEVSEFEGGNKS
jgi:hypothetical protein